ncbi:MAG: PKD domain-containing protein [bacterium]|nr:PKD domain-containing protein [bacterium]
MGVANLTLGILLFLASFSVARAGLIVSEIAWMGTGESSTNEWIELLNDGEMAVDVSLYTLNWNDRSTALMGVLEPHSYYLLERGDDAVPGEVADLVYVGALGNGGELLEIRNSGVTEWSVDATEGWPAGDNTTKETMQWNGTTWITAVATPKQANILIEAPAEPEVAITSNKSPVTSRPYPDHSLPVAVETNYVVKILAPVYVAAGSEILLRAQGIPDNALYSYAWSFGDGKSSNGSALWHIYNYPGTYTAVIRATKGNKETMASQLIVVFEPKILIPSANNERIILKNESLYAIDLYKWRLVAGKYYYNLPRDTYIAPRATIAVPSYISELRKANDNVYLLSPSGALVAIQEIPTTEIAKKTEGVFPVAVESLGLVVASEVPSRVTVAPANAISKVAQTPAKEIQPLAISVADESVESVAQKNVFIVPKKTSRGLFAKMGAWIGGIFGYD